MQLPVKLELGAGHRPTRGYKTNDLHAFPGIDYPGEAWMLDLPDKSLDEVLALGFVEHLTYFQALDTFRNIHRMLKPRGLFLFDVPDYPAWCAYYMRAMAGAAGPDDPSMDHIRRTLFGWQRWPGDEHKYGWDREHLSATLCQAGFTIHAYDMSPFVARTHRDRFHRKWDAHLYVVAER